MPGLLSGGINRAGSFGNGRKNRDVVEFDRGNRGKIKCGCILSLNAEGREYENEAVS